MTSLRLRIAVEDDIEALREVMRMAIAELQKGFLSPDELAASFDIMGLDTQLIVDRTYFAVEDWGASGMPTIVGCGGWSRRRTLFGGDHSAGRDAALLDPGRDAAKVRAMYTHPAHARRGVGRLVLDACEKAAAAEGFTRLEMAATLAGVPLYEACGYRKLEAFSSPTRAGVDVPLWRMGKDLPS